MAKTKSDASTCTRDLNTKTFICTADIENTMLNYELDEADKDNNNIVMLHSRAASAIQGDIKQTGNIKHDAGYELHDMGHVNTAYQTTENDSPTKVLNSKSRSKLTSQISSVSNISRSSDDGSSGLDSGSDESDVSTTFIDGKQAVSLSNFSKYTEQQQRKEIRANGGPLPKPMGPTFGYQMASAGFRSAKPLNLPR